MKKQGGYSFLTTVRYVLLVCVIICGLISIIGSSGGGGGGSDDSSSSLGDNQDYKIADSTKVLDESTKQNLLYVSPDGAIFTFSETTPLLEELSPGDVIVSDSTEAAPNGFLRKVSSISQDGNQIVLYTEPATLEDAIQNGNVEISQSLTPSNINAAVALRAGVSLQETEVPMLGAEDDGFNVVMDDVVLYDDDGDLNTTNDQIKANGHISFNPSFNFSMMIDDFQLKQLTFTTTAAETAQIELYSEASGNIADLLTELQRSGILPPYVEITELGGKIEIARYAFSPITVWVGWVPIVITPILTVDVCIDGTVSVGIATSVTQEASYTAGLTYDYGTWNPISYFSNNFQYSSPTLSADAYAKAYGGPQLDLLLYGIVGPYGDINGYLQLNADINSDPWWVLYGGLEAIFGIKVEVLSHDVADYSATVIDLSTILAQASSNTQNGTVSGTVRDAVSGSALQDVTVNVYSLDSLLATGMSNTSGVYNISVPVGSEYLIEFSKTGFLTATYNNITVEANTTSYLETVLQIDAAYSGTGDISGTIVSALDGSGVSGLTVQLREGINTYSGTTIRSTITGSGGYYNITDLSAGHYTAEVSGSGYNTMYFTIICIGGTTTANQNSAITPILSAGETRIIVTWGASPSDLDSHLTGPIPGSTSRFHVYYANTGSDTSSPYAELDIDDVTSYGPETITIYQQFDGIYRYSVHDYTDRLSNSSYALSNSGAQVKVYRGNSLVATFNVPANQGGTLWTVFEMSDDVITPINSMTYESSPSDILLGTYLDGVTKTDAPLIRNLPLK